MNPADLAERGLADGVEVNLSSRVGALRVVVQSDEKITQGVVCLPHGWGHNRTTGKQHIAEQHAGVSFNDIADELAVDPVSGNAVLNGIPVEVSA
jgi:anaerobic selenocysteine-containing dehydrogenase